MHLGFRGRRARQRGDRGAAAVEFALVSPLLLVLLFGLVDYGLYFADVLTVQQGVAGGARSATVAPYAGSPSPQWGTQACPLQTVPLNPAAGSQLEPLLCSTLAKITPIEGVLYVKAELVDAQGRPTSAWAVGNTLRLCAMADHAAVLPFVPLPQGGRITTRVEMPVQAAPQPVDMNPMQSDVSALSTDWSWC
jgi:Flp pilus assembly protein TadG